jgi:sodium/hydrogen antiporter
LFAICSLVVLLSVVLHGGSLMLLSRNLWPGGTREQPQQPQQPQVASVPPGQPSVAAAPVIEAGPAPAAERSFPLPLTPLPPAPERAAGNGAAVGEEGEAQAPAPPASLPMISADHERITVEEMRRLQQMGKPVIVLDVRSERTYEGSDLHAGGAVRLNPEYAAQEAKERGLPRDAWLVAFCA